MAEQVEGIFTFTIMDENNNLYFVKGENPIAIYHYYKLGLYIYASTDELLQKSVTKLGLKKHSYQKIQMNCGDILKINRFGEREKLTFDISNLMSYGYSFLNKYYHAPYTDSLLTRHSNEQTRLDVLLEYASSMGVAPEEIEMLLDYGYDESDIEDLIYDPLQLRTCINEIYSEEVKLV